MRIYFVDPADWQLGMLIFRFAPLPEQPLRRQWCAINAASVLSVETGIQCQPVGM